MVTSMAVVVEFWIPFFVRMVGLEQTLYIVRWEIKLSQCTWYTGRWHTDRQQSVCWVAPVYTVMVVVQVHRKTLRTFTIHFEVDRSILPLRYRVVDPHQQRKRKRKHKTPLLPLSSLRSPFETLFDGFPSYNVACFFGVRGINYSGSIHWPAKSVDTYLVPADCSGSTYCASAQPYRVRLVYRTECTSMYRTEFLMSFCQS